MKNVLLIQSSPRGSVLSNGPLDFLGPYLKTVFGFIGLTDVTVIRVEGTSDPKEKDGAIAKGRERLEEALASA